jgi:hypothetical protein
MRSKYRCQRDAQAAVNGDYHQEIARIILLVIHRSGIVFFDLITHFWSPPELGDT